MSDTGLNVGGLIAQSRSIPAQPANSTDNNYSYGITLPNLTAIPSVNGVCSGSLSCHGSIIAGIFNGGQGKYKYFGTGQVDENGVEILMRMPWLTGYAREYWVDPTKTTFGANSAMPALTAVMPGTITETPGNALYYIDLQLTRLTGSNFFNNYTFINSFNQVLNWTQTANNYLISVKNSENKNLRYYGSKTYTEFLTQGFSNYAIGRSLRAALTNIGHMIRQIPSARFGTSNAVAKEMIDSGLGAIGQLTNKLIIQGVNLNDIYNPIYSEIITSVLQTITNASDLQTIQSVLKSSIPNIKSPNDFTSIEKCAGFTNDSPFQTFRSFGIDLYQRAPAFTIQTGTELVNLIDTVLSENFQAVNNLATPSSMLPKSITDSLKQFLPISPDGNPITIMNVLGCATGYLTPYLLEVNRGIDALTKTAYGPQLHNAFTNIEQKWDAVIKEESFAYSYAGTGDTGIGYTIPIDPRFYAALEQSQKDYFNLLTTIVNDPSTKVIAEQINNNWLKFCQLLSIEVQNYNKANLSANVGYTDNSLIYSFVSSIPQYSNDTSRTGSDFFLYSLCQPNEAGEVVKSLLNQTKNNNLLANAGVQIKGEV